MISIAMHACTCFLVFCHTILFAIMISYNGCVCVCVCVYKKSEFNMKTILIANMILSEVAI